jgi:hypothetical protein
MGRIAQLVRAPALHAGSRGFESLFAHLVDVSDPVITHGVLLFNAWEVRTVKSTRRQAALAAGVFALVLMSGPAVAGAQPGVQQMQRGGPPNPDTPRILVSTFKSSEKDIGVQAADAVRRRISDQNSGKVLWVVTKRDIDATLSQSGYKPDSALSTSDLMELGKQVRADEVLDATVSKAPEGVKVEPRLLIKRGQTILAQPLPPVTAKSAGDAAKDIEKALADARKSIAPFKACENELRAQKYDAAAAQGRAALTAYPQSTFGRLCVFGPSTPRRPHLIRSSAPQTRFSRSIPAAFRHWRWPRTRTRRRATLRRASSTACAFIAQIRRTRTSPSRSFRSWPPRARPTRRCRSSTSS